MVIFNEEKILQAASALTYVTVLGIIPFALFLITFFPNTPPFNILDQIKPFLAKLILPEYSEDFFFNFDTIFHELFKLKGSLTFTNIIVLIISSYCLFNTITSVYDRILKIKVKRNRSTFLTLVKLFGMIVLGFLVFSLLLSTAYLPYFQGFFALNIIRQMTNFLIPLLFWFLLINFTYRILPNVKLKNKTIWIAASISAIVWFVAKLGFDFYISNMTSMKQIYGIISSFPIFLFWIYLNWVFVLSGVVILSMLNPDISSQEEVEVSAKIEISINKKITREIESKIDIKDKAEIIKKIVNEIVNTELKNKE
jgi:membrane protein